jgi:hypothetical protein
MKAAASIAIVAVSLLSGAGTASAEVNYPWCVITGGTSEGVMSCGFVSLAQCMQTRVGVEMCVPNPLYQGPSAPPAGKRRTGGRAS